MAARKTSMKKKIQIVEVGPRDGLQNEKVHLSIDQRIDLIRRLVGAGVSYVEAGSFVRPEWVPQMAKSAEVFEKIKKEKADFGFLVPNERGMLDAIAAGVKEVAIFAACSESFSKKNLNCTIDESFERFIPVMRLAKKHKIKVRGYLSVCFGCPFEGTVSVSTVVRLAKKMIQLGVYQVSIGDTIGVATAFDVERLFKKLKTEIPVKKLAGHFHNTRGQALANIFVCYKLGVKTFDSSVGGTGGCPYAPGASGNVATEDVVYLFEKSGLMTGINRDRLIEISNWLKPILSRNC